MTEILPEGIPRAKVVTPSTPTHAAHDVTGDMLDNSYKTKILTISTHVVGPSLTNTL